MTEPNSSDSRGERLDFFLKQEEALTTEPGFNESEEAGAGAGGGTISSVANLKAALMSKNSLLSLRAEMMGDDNPLLYEYLPKGGHSLSCKSLSSNYTHNFRQTHSQSNGNAFRYNKKRKYTGLTAFDTSVLCGVFFTRSLYLDNFECSGCMCVLPLELCITVVCGRASDD